MISFKVPLPLKDFPSEISYGCNEISAIILAEIVYIDTKKKKTQTYHSKTNTRCLISSLKQMIIILNEFLFVFIFNQI
jgi:hypothetical protein